MHLIHRYFRIGFLILFAPLLLISSCQNGKNPNGIEKINQTDESGKKQGVWRYYFPDGSLQSEVNYTEDLKSGEEIQYFPSGKINVSMEWIADNGASILQGNYKHYNNEGILIMELFYNEGIPEGTVKHFYQDGTINIEGQYSKGMKTGQWKTYRNDGSLQELATYLSDDQPWNDDTKHGLIWYFDEHSNPYLQERYFKGQLINDSIINPIIYRQQELN